MPIRVTCRHCGKAFSAWDDLAGKSAQCPKCNQQMIVPDPKAGLQSAAPSAPAAPAAPRRKAAATPATSPERPRATPSPTPQSSPSPLPNPMPTLSAQRSGGGAGAAPSTPAHDFHPDDIGGTDELPFACPKCGHSMPQNEDLCDSCGFHRILGKCIDMDGIHVADKSTGFERMMKGQLRDDESPESAILWLKLLVGFIALGLLLLGPWWMKVLIAIAIAVAGGFWAKAKSQGESGVNQSAVSTVVWGFLLVAQRIVGWRVLEWPFPKTRALTLHDPSFTDEDLAALENLGELQTLDLANTQVTDGGLARLETMKQLRFLVFTNSQVSESGVTRLQQKLPKAWIWA